MSKVPSRVRDLTGLIFSRFSVLEYAGKDKYSNSQWLCQCECGNKKVIVSYELTSGGTKSCGCLRRDVTISRNTSHGLSNHPLYHTWTGMLYRCSSSKATGYENYGGRGISVCPRWSGENGFENFLSDMESSYVPGTTLDRFPNPDGNYEPENCRWATRVEQNRNTRRVKLNEDKVREIRSDLRRHADIALHYGIDESHVSDIKSFKVWKEIS